MSSEHITTGIQLSDKANQGREILCGSQFVGKVRYYEKQQQQGHKGHVASEVSKKRETNTAAHWGPS